MNMNQILLFSVMDEMADLKQDVAPHDTPEKIYTIWDIPPGSRWDKGSKKSKGSGDSPVKRLSRFVMGFFR